MLPTAGERTSTLGFVNELLRFLCGGQHQLIRRFIVDL